MLRQQIDFLLRNEKAVGTLDLDVLLNRTRSIYEQLCGIGIEEEADEPDQTEQAEQIVPAQTEPLENAVTAVQEEEKKEHGFDVENASLPRMDLGSENVPADEPTEKASEGSLIADEPMENLPDPEPTIQEPSETQEMETATSSVASDLGFLFKLADEPGTTEVVDNKVVHYIEQIPESEITEQDLKDMEPRHENLYEMPPMDSEEPIAETLMPQETPETMDESGEEAFAGTSTLFDWEKQEEQLPLEPEAILAALEPDDAAAPALNLEATETDGFLFDIPSQPIELERPFVAEKQEEDLPTPLIIKPSTENQPEESEAAFELEEPAVLGDKMRHDDNSLAAKLNKKPVDSLKTAIGINDKFLFVNELFGGSMEKFNKSIDNLNDLKTLNGALIYLNELKIELQWNSSNEAYRKLSDLVSRKFE